MLVIEGARIRLEPLERSHLDDLCEIGLDPALWRFTTIRVQTNDEMKDYIHKALHEQSEGTCIPFVIRHKERQSLIGSTRFHHLETTHKRVEIGFTWLSPSYQKLGLNKEAKHLMLNHAFEVLGCNRVEFRAD